MSSAVEVVLWVAVGLLVYSYLGFPALMALLARLSARPARSAPRYRPTVSILISAFNEAESIRRKIDNTFALDYPPELLEIVFVTDGSTDGTDAIAREYEARGATVLHQPERRGKSAAIARAMPRCRGDIVIFSDANTDYSPDAISRLVQHFADETVGGVSGRKIVLKDVARAATIGEIVFCWYEAQLKTWESAAGSIVSADGEIFAIRRSLYEGLPEEIVHDDMYLTLSLVQRGFRVLYEPGATSAEYASSSLLDEFHRKLRYASAGYQILSYFPSMFWPVPTGFGLLFLSHKLLRWMAPVLLIVVFAASAGLAGSGLAYAFMFWGQVTFYGMAALGFLVRRWSSSVLLHFPLYFSVMNAAALYGLFRHVAGGQSPVWRKAER